MTRLKKLAKNLKPSVFISIALSRPVLVLVAVFTLIFSAYHLYYAQKVIPGVVIGNIAVGGMTYDRTVVAVSNISSKPQDLIVKHNSVHYVISPAGVGLEYDVAANIARAFEVGRTGNFLLDLKDKAAGLIGVLDVRTIYKYNDASLDTVFSKIRGETNKEGNNAAMVISGNSLTVVEAADGVKVDDDALYDKVVYAFDFLDFNPIALPVKDWKAKVKSADLTDIVTEVEKLVFSPTKLVDGEKEWRLTPQQKLSFLTFGAQDGAKKYGFNARAFDSYIDTLSKEVNTMPKGKVTQTSGDRVVGFEIIQEGKRLNGKKFILDFKKAFFDTQPSVELTMEPYGALNDATDYGIFALLGEGKSKFTGSIPARVHNLSLAAERTSGILVPPGDTYSFNDSVFRAILNSGLPVIARYPHAYRVAYYELDQPVGLDASIFQPSLDLQFKNDTPNYVLVQASVDVADQSLSFKMYGTPDGRKVTVSQPVVTNQSPPPLPLYEDDPTLAKGVVRQVDFSAWGATATFTRTVEKDGKILYEDNFSSTYQPWRAIFKVGTKT
ncbi:MAG: hypothetical protein UX79_C0037G0004 [candidate division WWE3 bacterium GW2011_GWB1_47_11]|uniref:G5 domain-containing protein n=1 Tax=candidate division WWE3 bacterium GW2011_GWB1_47_11 TaxID=1619117 RepID=A0A0G1RG36_UNCKA|nr:MAG: hypothetical protein UX79_C0037G0004 [candidate division WWE3 bacterium GW2011_GWB1_47_11]